MEGALPDLRGAAVVTVSGPSNIAVGEAVWGLPEDGRIDPGRAPDLPAVGGPVIVQVRDAHRHGELGTLLRVLENGRPMVVVEWGWPGAHTGSPRICTRGYSRPGAAAVTELLRKAGWDR